MPKNETRLRGLLLRIRRPAERLDWRNETISMPGNRLDESRVDFILLKRPPYLPDSLFDCVFVLVRSPDRIQEFSLSDGAAAVPYEIRQNFERLWSEVDALLSAKEASLPQIESELANPQYLVLKLASAATCIRTHISHFQKLSAHLQCAFCRLIVS